MNPYAAYVLLALFALGFTFAYRRGQGKSFFPRVSRSGAVVPTPVHTPVPAAAVATPAPAAAPQPIVVAPAAAPAAAPVVVTNPAPARPFDWRWVSWGFWAALIVLLIGLGWVIWTGWNDILVWATPTPGTPPAPGSSPGPTRVPLAASAFFAANGLWLILLVLVAFLAILLAWGYRKGSIPGVWMVGMGALLLLAASALIILLANPVWIPLAVAGTVELLRILALLAITLLVIVMIFKGGHLLLQRMGDEKAAGPPMALVYTVAAFVALLLLFGEGGVLSQFSPGPSAATVSSSSISHNPPNACKGAWEAIRVHDSGVLVNQYSRCILSTRHPGECIMVREAGATQWNPHIFCDVPGEQSLPARVELIRSVHGPFVIQVKLDPR
jgi:hypothetical protein